MLQPRLAERHQLGRWPCAEAGGAREPQGQDSLQLFLSVTGVHIPSGLTDCKCYVSLQSWSTRISHVRYTTSRRQIFRYLPSLHDSIYITRVPSSLLRESFGVVSSPIIMLPGVTPYPTPDYTVMSIHQACSLINPNSIRLLQKTLSRANTYVHQKKRNWLLALQKVTRTLQE